MKRLLPIALFALTAALSFGATPTPAPSPAPTAAPTPATITLSDGHAYTAQEIEARISELIAQRNQYVGQVIDLNATVQKLQAAQAAPPKK